MFHFGLLLFLNTTINTHFPKTDHITYIVLCSALLHGLWVWSKKINLYGRCRLWAALGNFALMAIFRQGWGTESRQRAGSRTGPPCASGACAYEKPQAVHLSVITSHPLPERISYVKYHTSGCMEFTGSNFDVLFFNVNLPRTCGIS